VSARDRAIGIVLGVILGLAIVIAFVFFGSQDTIDDPSVADGGAKTEKSSPTAPSTPGLPTQEVRP
jgi:hypothetical protein